MKLFTQLNLLGLSGLVIFTIGCGSSTPFQRGVAKANHTAVNNEKPGSEKPVVENPTRTDVPSATNTPIPAPVSLNRTYFTNEILPMLEAKKINGTTKGCSMCHGNPAPTFEEASNLVVIGHPEESILFKKAIGAEGSSHMKIWNADSPEALKLILWISGKSLF